MPDLKGNTIIVIDPGHGGENLGAQIDGYTEKEMTLIVARAMKEELETYDNVVVYLTRESDQELSLEERAQFAKDRNADFLFCLLLTISYMVLKSGYLLLENITARDAALLRSI